jgi:predicted TPR repeat methyltransferase
MLFAQAGSETGDMMMVEDLQQVFKEAVRAHEQEEFFRAVDLYGKILRQYPDADIVLYNQGLALYELGRFAEAGEAFRSAAAIRGDDADTWFNLALSLKQQGRYTEACRIYERALMLQPDNVDILYNLANCCREDNRLDEAARWYEKVLELQPDHLAGINNLAGLCHRRGELERARSLYHRILYFRPGHPGALHMLAALEGSVREAPPTEYVRDLFDHYSDHFDQSLLEKLEYRVPELLFDLCCRFPVQDGYRNCLDLGCGTGLAGLAFRTLCLRLAGVDLSRKMVDQARDKNVYDELADGDVVEFLNNCPERFDLFVAADVLTYLGELQPLFQAVADRSLPDARFVFSTEHGENREPGWLIRSTGRFAHHPEYIARMVEQSGGRLLCSEPADLRREGEAWIRGDIYLVEFPGS